MVIQLSGARNEAEDAPGYVGDSRRKGREDALLQFMENKWYRYARWAIVAMVILTILGVVLSFTTAWMVRGGCSRCAPA